MTSHNDKREGKGLLSGYDSGDEEVKQPDDVKAPAAKKETHKSQSLDQKGGVGVMPKPGSFAEKFKATQAQSKAKTPAAAPVSKSAKPSGGSWGLNWFGRNHEPLSKNDLEVDIEDAAAESKTNDKSPKA